MTAAIDEILRGAVARGDVAGIVGVSVRADGPIYCRAFGRQRVAEDVPMQTDTVFRLASITKGFTAVGAMQLIESGALDLDAPASDVVPDLGKLQVIADDGSLRPARRPITLRHLLTHTSGLAYGFSSARFAQFAADNDIPGVLPDGRINIRTALLFDPGERWQYGVGIDWVGEMMEQVTGVPLARYLGEHLFEPLAMSDTIMGELTEGQIARLATSHTRMPDGSLTERALATQGSSGQGGAGALSTADDYSRYLQFMLSGGEWNGRRLLSEGSFAQLSTNQIGELVAGAFKTGDPERSNDADFTEGGTAGHSLGFVVSKERRPTGRSAGTMSWGGISNSYFWIDRARDVAGAVFMQILPFADPICLNIRDSFERAVYASLAETA